MTERDDSDSGTEGEQQPCGEYHPLPCGLDVDCPESAEGSA